MISEKYTDLVTGHLLGILSASERGEFNDLIARGELDPADIRGMEKIYEQVGLIGVPEPDDHMRDRFYSMLEAEKSRQEKGKLQEPDGWFVRVQGRAGFRPVIYAAAVFLIGLLAGILYSPLNSQDDQIDRLTAEIYQMREMMMISLLDDSSPTERLKAVNISTGIPSASADNRVIEALLRTLNNDSNVNVRIAAANALVRHGSNPEARSGLIHSIVSQESPIVQVALADAMLALQEEESVDEFRKLLEKNGLDENVREKLEITIAALR